MNLLRRRNVGWQHLFLTLAACLFASFANASTIVLWDDTFNDELGGVNSPDPVDAGGPVVLADNTSLTVSSAVASQLGDDTAPYLRSRNTTSQPFSISETSGMLTISPTTNNGLRVAPAIDFNAVLPTASITGFNVKIEGLDPQATNTQWAGVGLFKGSVPETASNPFVIAGDTGLSLLVRGNGGLQVFQGGANFISEEGILPTEPMTLELAITNLVGYGTASTSMDVALLINNVPLSAPIPLAGIDTTVNYVFLESHRLSTNFDQLTITATTAVPEPTAAVLGLLALAGGACVWKRLT